MKEADFERLWAAHAERLLGFLVVRTANRQIAEDILADTFERVFKARRPFDPRRGKEQAWLYTIALNVLRDRARRESAEGRALDRMSVGAGDADPALDRIEAGDAVGRALRVLNEEEREAVALRYGADLTVPEIAKLTGEPLTTAEGRVYRALRKLREELATDE